MDLEEERRVCDAATPGPWNVGWDGGIYGQYARDSLPTLVSPGKNAAIKHEVPNAKFIAHARTGYPLLLAIAEAAQGMLLDDSEAHVQRGTASWCDACGLTFPCPTAELREALAAFRSAEVPQ